MDNLTETLHRIKEQTGGGKYCPAHNDKNRSLTASCTEERILVKCHTGCTFEEIVSASGMELSQFFAKEISKTPKSREVARYRYEDKEGSHDMGPKSLV